MARAPMRRLRVAEKYGMAIPIFFFVLGLPSVGDNQSARLFYFFG